MYGEALALPIASSYIPRPSIIDKNVSTSINEFVLCRFSKFGVVVEGPQF